MAGKDGKGILDEFADFLAAKQQADRDAVDPDVFLSTTDPDGNRHELTISASKAGRWIFEKFGIGEDPDAKDGDGNGDGDGKTEDGKQQRAGSGVPNLFRRASGS